MGLWSLILQTWNQPEELHGLTPLRWSVDNNSIRQDQVSLFNNMESHLKLRVDPNSGDLSKIIVQSQAGVGPDLFCCYTSSALSALVKSGIALDISDRLEELNISSNKELWNGATGTSTFEGRTYGMPNNVAVDALWINKQAFLGKEDLIPDGPITWYDFLKIAQKMTIVSDNGKVSQYGFNFQWSQWKQFLIQFGATVYSEDGTECILNMPQAVAAFQFMQDLIYKYKVSPTPIEEAGMASSGGWGGGLINQFAGGRYAMAMGGRWWTISLKQFEGLDLTVNEAPHKEGNRIFLSYGKSTLINAKSDKKEEAFKFLKFLASEQYHDLIYDQGDGFGGIMKFTKESSFPSPLPENSDVWYNIMKHAEPFTESPFVNGGIVDRLISQQLDMIRSNMKSAQEAMDLLTVQINREIQQEINRDPSLKLRYEKLKGGM